MLHPATQAVERYYTLFNEKDWPGIAAMFDLPATLIVGPRKVLLEHPDAVTTLYRGLGERCDLIVVKTVVTREAADRTPIKTWNCSYTLRLVGKVWLFTLITSDDTGNAKAGPTPASS